MAAYRRVYDLRSPAGWLPVHRDQLQAQCSVSSMGTLYIFNGFTARWYICMLRTCVPAADIQDDWYSGRVHGPVHWFNAAVTVQSFHSPPQGYSAPQTHRLHSPRLVPWGECVRACSCEFNCLPCFFRTEICDLWMVCSNTSWDLEIFNQYFNK